MFSKIRLAVLTCTLFAVPAALAGERARDVDPTADPFAEINAGHEASRRGLRVSARLDKRRAVYRIGETVTVSVTVNQDAFISIIDRGTSGRVRLIFPNEFAPDNRVRGGAAISIPVWDAGYTFDIKGPPGTENLSVIATHAPVSMLELERFAGAGPFPALSGEAEEVARDVGVALKRGQADGHAAVPLSFEIVDDPSYRPSFGDDDRGRRPGPPRRRTGALNAAQDFYARAEALSSTGQGDKGGAEARRLYHAAADAGHVGAMQKIGRFYEMGEGVPKDIFAAAVWFRKAAELGNTPSMIRLARIYVLGLNGQRKPWQAMRWLSRAAKAGDAMASMAMAFACDKGQGVPRDPGAAARHLLAALEGGAWIAANEAPKLSPAARREIQRQLKAAGLDPGALDGEIGPATRAAMMAFAAKA